MPYDAEISRSNPTCFLFLIDRSGSMSELLAGGSGKTKANGVADAVNKLLDTLVQRNTKGSNVLDRFQVGVIGYGDKVGPALGGVLAERSLVPLGELADHPLELEERTKKVQTVDDAMNMIESEATVYFPVWFKPVAHGGTPMCAALELARNTINEFIEKFPACYPPLVINMTDGECGDGNPEPPADMIRQMASQNGNVLLFNVHISSGAATAIEFANESMQLPDDYARQLFRMSSILPAQMLPVARLEYPGINETSRGYVFNADLVSLVRFLDIGTRVDARNQR